MRTIYELPSLFKYRLLDFNYTMIFNKKGADFQLLLIGVFYCFSKPHGIARLAAALSLLTAS